MSKERKNNVQIDDIGAVASGGVGDSGGVGVQLSLFTYFEFDSPFPPVRNHQNNKMLLFVITIVIIISS